MNAESVDGIIPSSEYAVIREQEFPGIVVSMGILNDPPDDPMIIISERYDDDADDGVSRRSILFWFDPEKGTVEFHSYDFGIVYRAFLPELDLLFDEVLTSRLTLDEVWKKITTYFTLSTECKVEYIARIIATFHGHDPDKVNSIATGECEVDEKGQPIQEFVKYQAWESFAAEAFYLVKKLCL